MLHVYRIYGTSYGVTSLRSARGLTEAARTRALGSTVPLSMSMSMPYRKIPPAEGQEKPQPDSLPDGVERSTAQSAARDTAEGSDYRSRSEPSLPDGGERSSTAQGAPETAEGSAGTGVRKFKGAVTAAVIAQRLRPLVHETEEGTREDAQKKAWLDPDQSVALKLWNMTLVCTILYTVLITLFNLSFLRSEDAVTYESESTWTSIVTVLWTADIAVGFVQPFWDPQRQELVTDSCRIASRYCKGFLIVDVLAVGPCIVAMFVVGTRHELAPFLQAGGSRLLKALRLGGRTTSFDAIGEFAHLVVSQVVPSTRSSYQSHGYSSLRHRVDSGVYMLRRAVLFFTVVHMVGCVWFTVGANDTDIATGWVAKQNWDEDVPPMTCWLRAFYWSITTFTTVGYGDISATTNLEMAYTTLAMILAMVVNAWLIATLTKYLARLTLSEDEHEDLVAKIETYMNIKRVPSALQQKVMNFLKIQFDHERCVDIHEVLRSLPPALECEMIDFLYLKDFRKCDVFDDIPQPMLIALSKQCLPCPMKKGEMIFEVGDSAREVYLLQCGTDVRKPATVELKLYEDPDSNSNDFIRKTEVSSSDEKVVMLGGEALDFAYAIEVRRTVSAKALADLNLILIDASEMERLHQEHTEAGLQLNVLNYQRAFGDLIGRPDDPVVEQSQCGEQDHTNVSCVVPGEERLRRLEAGEFACGCVLHPANCQGICQLAGRLVAAAFATTMMAARCICDL